jgi:uncharacterized protein YutE (UPF0331/DUF86 family)
MTFLVERLAELRRHLVHLRKLAPKVVGPESLEKDLDLHNNVLFSLFMVSQAVIDIASELATRHAIRFHDYREAVAALAAMDAFPDELVRQLLSVPGFRNVLVHEYVQLDLARAVEALNSLEGIDRFVTIVAELEKAKDASS